LRQQDLAHLFQIQGLFPHPLDVSFYIETQAGHLDPEIANGRALGKYSIRFSVHFLEQEIQALANLTARIEEAA
jgi:hypothetical protein